MKNDLLEFNKFSYMHDGKSIYFAKISFLKQALDDIRKIENEVILITGNGDYGIYFQNGEFIVKDLNNNFGCSFEFSFIPSNLKVWFAVNNLTDLYFIKTIPLGIGNSIECMFPEHTGDMFYEKIKNISTFDNFNLNEIKNDIYFNFDTSTNFNYRNEILKFCIDNKFFIDSRVDSLEFYKKIQQHKAVLCPSGNGVDTYRFYETLILGRVPILLKHGNYPIYDQFYSHFPCIILNDVRQLLSDELNNMIETRLSIINKEKVSFSFWQNYILSHLKN